MFRTALSAIALTTALSGMAFAETSKVVVPSADGAVTAPTSPRAVVTVPTPSSMGTAGTPLAAPVGPALSVEQLKNDQTVSETLIAQGYTDIRIAHEGTLMTVNAVREGKPLELVYQTTSGQLVKMNGQPVLTEEQAQMSRGDKGNVTEAKPAESAKDAAQGSDSATETETNSGDTASDSADSGSSEGGASDGTTN